jgi:hypothetical protein
MLLIQSSVTFVSLFVQNKVSVVIVTRFVYFFSTFVILHILISITNMVIFIFINNSLSTVNQHLVNYLYNIL